MHLSFFFFFLRNWGAAEVVSDLQCRFDLKSLVSCMSFIAFLTYKKKKRKLQSRGTDV